MKKIIIVFVFLLLGDAFAADISWMYVQNRRYENGRNINRLAFGLLDEQGHILTDDGSVANIKLYAPGGKEVKLKKHRFDSDIEIFGLYDAIQSRWRYSSDWQFDSWFRANFSEPLVAGTYRLKITTVDGKTAEGSCTVNAIVELPNISSQSFKFYPDAFGNVIWKWDIPDDLGYLIYDRSTEARAAIDIYKDEKSVAYFFVKIPTHLSYVFIPNSVVRKINAKGNQFGLKVQLETRDKNSRTYSNTVMIKDMTAVLPQSDGAK